MLLLLLGKYTAGGHDTEGSASKSDAGLAHSFIAGRVAAALGQKESNGWRMTTAIETRVS